MTIKISNPAEAFAAIASVMIAADGLGSMEERRSVLEKLSASPSLAGQDGAALGALLGRVTDHLVETLPVSESGAFTPAAVTTLLTVVKPVLNAAQRAECIRLAETTAGADGASDAENAILAQLRAGLAG